MNPGGPPFKFFCEDYLAWHEREFPDSHFRVRQIVEQHLVPYFEFDPIGTLERVAAERYKHERTAKPATIAKELRTLQAIINKAVEWEKIPRNPLKGVKPPKNTESRPPPFYTESQLSDLWSCSTVPHKWKFLANTGLRRAEAMNIQRSHCGPESIVVVSETGSRTKSGKWRQVPLNNSARLALQRLFEESKTDFVFPRVNPRSLSRAFDNDLRRSKLPGSIHWLRHTYVSHLVMNGVPLRTVQILAGHANITTTERYAHLAPDFVTQQAMRMEL